MIEIKTAQKSDIKEIANFYKKQGYGGDVNINDYILIATEDNKIIGVVRLCNEEETLVLRGMQIEETYQKQGIGKELLKKLNEIIGDKICYCLPYAHLEKFYSIIGFQKIEAEEAPPFLKNRFARYQSIFDTPGIIMKRGTSPNSA